MDEKHTNIELGNNNSEINVIINENEAKLYEKIEELSSDLAWIEQELRIRDLIIQKLIRILKRYGQRAN